MITSHTPTLDAIATHGNRGHHFPNTPDMAADIVCNDGTMLSVVAGNSLWTDPYVLPCCEDARLDHNDIPPGSEIVAHDYAGPYKAVEVRTDHEEILEMLGITWPFPEARLHLDVELVRQFILDHGGEFTPIAEAERVLQHASNEVQAGCPHGCPHDH